MSKLKSPEYEKLRKDYLNTSKTFADEREKLREKIFREVNKPLRMYEEEAKQEFLSLWNKYGNSDYVFENIKINLNPLNWHNDANIMTLVTPNERLDLEEITKKTLNEKNETMQISYYTKSKDIETSIQEHLEELNLFPGWSKINEIAKFQKDLNIIGFYPTYFEK